MAIDHRIGNKVAANLRKEDAGGIRVDPYPYIALVKNNYDPTRSGRLQVWIPDLGGDQEDPHNWRTVSYASPFMGYTSSNNNPRQTPSTANTFENSRHSYGMWMVPPDVGVEVLVLFVAGDPLRGYWLACINSGLSHHMVPALAGSPNIADDHAQGAVLPVVEFNEYDQKAYTNPSFYTNPKPVHKTQYNILRNQGLDRDPIRGAISSSSQRESPSHVFGISTPGRPYNNDPADDSKNFVKNLLENNLPAGWDTVTARKGGHSLVMDDGATLGQDQLVRLRTAKGHQLLLHDTDNSIYISHANGNSWLEMDSNGHIKVYAKSGLSVRSENVINLHSDGDINIQAENNIKLKAGNQLSIEAGKTSLLTAGGLSVESKGKTEFLAGGGFNVKSLNAMSLVAGTRIALSSPSILNSSGGGEDVASIKELSLNKHNDTTLNGMTWTNKPNVLSSIVTLAPSHEPYPRILPSFFNPFAVSEQQLQASYTGAVDAIKSVPGTSINDKASIKDLRKHLLDQTVPINTVGNLSKDQMTAYLAQIGASESRVGTTKGVGNGRSGYECQNELGFIGKYQFGYQALIDQGYVKSSVTSLAQLDNPNSWTGKDGIVNKDAWFGNPSIQESAMLTYTQTNYTRMVANGAITADMPPEEVGGMLAVAHLLGPNKGTPARPGALGWRQGLGGADALGSTGDEYFQKGKFAVSVLSQQVAAVNEG